MIAPGEIASLSLLPSLRYHPAPGELDESDLQLPWPRPQIGDNTPQSVIGVLARTLGAKTQGRVVASAKSWLSHPSVDRTAPILPWGSSQDVVKVSPVIASASYLAHVKSAWNARFNDSPLEKQDIVITVPASFDDAARSLTLEATRIAGLTSVHLVEEPLAVCYHWLQCQKDLLRSLSDFRLLLVCDIGGGTTDFTLIKNEADQQQPKLTRIGVGDHLMLGGDNIDLTLARLAEKRLLADGKRLSTAEIFQLVEQCRVAKERLLNNEDIPENFKVTLLGAGAKLIGGARSTELSRTEVKQIVLDGFFPLCTLTDYPNRKRIGVVEFGLPYVADPAISKHIAAFLGKHQQACKDALQDSSNPVPDAILFNGGVFRSQLITRQILDLIASWSSKKLHHLENDQPELAVALGAIAYAMARRGEQIKIGGGSARSYFLVVDDEKRKSEQGVCVLPRGIEEGTEVFLSERTFSLRLGQPVRFHLVSSTDDNIYQAGEIISIDTDRFIVLPPLAAALNHQDSEQSIEIDVQLVASLNEVGTMQLQCVSVADPNQRWDLQFQLRLGTTGVTFSGDTVHPKFDDAAKHIALIFGKKTKSLTPKAVKGTRAELEKILGNRVNWDTPLLRELFGALLYGLSHRRRSADHERIWLSLTGYCLRPGFGYALDDWRIEQLWRIYSQGLQFINEAQNWSEWWTLWRRVAGGLQNQEQSQLFADIEKYINPATARQGNISIQIKKRGYDDMVRLAAVLEHLSVDQKVKLGNWFLKRLNKPSEPDQTWWAIGRVGGRIPFHGSTHNVIPSEIVEQWLTTMLSLDWKKNAQLGFAATLLSRMSGDRERDIDGEIRNRIIERLRFIKAPNSWIQMIENIKKLDEADEKRIFGEGLPPGLRLLD